MKNLAYLLLLLFSLTSISGEWYEDWPESLNADTPYYRGQRTDLASFDHLIDMLMNPDSDKVITSRMYRTLQKLFPKMKTEELIELSNSQYDYWRKERMLGWISNCHADPYMCYLPKIEKLMGVVFKQEHLPAAILQRLKKDRDENFEITLTISKGELLEFFDPVVSTSYRLDVAENFGRDKDGNDGYVLILNDKFHRNCSEKNKETADCFINNEEFMEELEFPMWGFVTGDELDGVIIEYITLKKLDRNKLLLIDSSQKVQFELEKGSAQSCFDLSRFSVQKPKLLRLQKALSNYFNCTK